MKLKDILKITEKNVNIEIRDTEHKDCLNYEKVIFYGEPQDFKNLEHELGYLEIVSQWVKNRTLVLEAKGVKNA